MQTNSALSIFKRLFSLWGYLLKASSSDNSYAGEFNYLKGVLGRLKQQGGYVVDMAASDGVSQSSTLGFFRSSAWSGLAIEMDPDKFSKLSFLYAGFPNARLARCRVTPLNVKNMLLGYEVPIDFTLLNLDIDSYDLHVINQILLAGFRPKVISMEINEKIPPPLYFTVDYDKDHFWLGDHFYGCSLTAAAEVVRPFGYILESLQYNNAIFIRADICDNLITDMNVEDAYNNGYRYREDRKALFPWNFDMEDLLFLSADDAVETLNQRFAKYSNKFTLRK